MNIRIMYIEDEPFLGRIVKESLESRGYEIVMHDDGEAALDLFRKSKPDICVLDIMLPFRDGYSLATGIRKMDPDMPIIFVSAKTQTQDLVKGFESGGNDYIRKPFSMEELIARIENLLRLKGRIDNAESTPVIRIGRYEYNPMRYELRCGESTRKLSHREANLLMMLAENRNNITNRRDILMRIWGDDSFFNSRNLDVYITRLREMLKADPAIEIITIKGVGYHFAVG